MQKRISALLLAMVIVIVSVLGGNTLKVKAASVAVSEEFAVELTMMLYNLLETVAISSGIKDGLDDYESGSSLYDAFIASVESMAEPPFYDTIITQPDGSQMTVKEALDAAESTLGSNALKLPTSETFAKYRVISGTGGNEPDPTPTPSSDPDNTPVPDTGYKDPFTYIQDVLVAGTLVSAMAGFFADLINGKIDGIDPDNYIPDGMFTGYPTESNAGKINIYASYFYNNSPTLSEEKYSYNATNEDCFYFLASYGTTASGSYILKPGIYYISSGRTVFPSYSFLQDDLGNAFTFNWISYPVPDTGYRFGNYTIVSNIPIFAHFGFDAYCKGDTSMLLHAPDIYDFPDLATSTAERLQPLTGYEFAPGRLPGINAALSTAAAALPEPGLDPAENTDAYKNALNAALTAALPQPAPEPEPEPDPSPDPGTDGEGESYKRDLRLIFPFCIPFDFIHFIKALSADPVAPCFKIPIKLDSLGIDMVLELDLAWMDPIMEIFRLGELGCFVIMLMAATKKMIGW